MNTVNTVEGVITQFFGQGHKWVNVEMKRPVKVKKGKPVYWKTTVGVYGLNADYGSGVNTRLVKEGKEANFVAKELPWGEWDVYPYSISHKGNKYLRLTCNHSAKPTVTYTDADGKVVDIDTVKAVALAGEFDVQENKSQGLENELKVFVIKEENLVRVWVN
jgi:hypothetical protein